LTQYVYPSLPGLKIDISRTPEFRTVVKESASGKEVRAAMRAYPRWRYQLGYEVLRTSSGLEELQKLVAFYGQVRGQFDDFLFIDPDFNAVTAQQFGVGDGVTQSFQLVRSVSGLGTTWAEPVWAPRGTPTIFINGTPTAATIGDLDQVRVPPAARVCQQVNDFCGDGLHGSTLNNSTFPADHSDMTTRLNSITS
jgi:uncharacterized protein (TIGR02217 family)